jgi:phosphatidate cytidylyltransferase
MSWLDSDQRAAIAVRASSGQPARRRAVGLSERKTISTGRNLPVAIAVGLGLGALAIATLFTVKATFLAVVALIVGAALWELSRAVRNREICVPLPPLAAGGAAMLALGYWQGSRDALATLAVTFIVMLAWRLPGGSIGYLRDITGGIFTLIYLPTLATFVALMLREPDGSRRVLLFLIVTVCSDVGGYFAGISIGRHQMAPVISPKKTWEGLGGSIAACLAGGAIGGVLLLHGRAWQGLVLGAGAVAAATLGDLIASMIKRDLNTKDWSSTLPGHGGLLDRLDSLLVVAPVAWLLMTVFFAR